MSNYDHAYSFGFSLQSNDGGGEDVTAEQLRYAIVEALFRMDDVDLLENCGTPFDTYEIEEIEDALDISLANLNREAVNPFPHEKHLVERALTIIRGKAKGDQ